MEASVAGVAAQSAEAGPASVSDSAVEPAVGAAPAEVAAAVEPPAASSLLLAATPAPAPASSPASTPVLTAPSGTEDGGAVVAQSPLDSAGTAATVATTAEHSAGTSVSACATAIATDTPDSTHATLAHEMVAAGPAAPAAPAGPAGPPVELRLLSPAGDECLPECYQWPLVVRVRLLPDRYHHLSCIFLVAWCPLSFILLPLRRPASAPCPLPAPRLAATIAAWSWSYCRCHGCNIRTCQSACPAVHLRRSWGGLRGRAGQWV